MDTPNPTNGSLVVPPHGRGRIRHGSQKGNTPGSGRPPSVIRRDARDSYDARREFLERVIDGEMIEQRVQAPGAAEPLVIRRSADIDDRLKALKELREVGLGALKAMNEEEVQDRLTLTIRDADNELPRLIQRMMDGDAELQMPQDVASAFVDLIERHWR